MDFAALKDLSYHYIDWQHGFLCFQEVDRSKSVDKIVSCCTLQCVSLTPPLYPYFIAVVIIIVVVIISL